MYAGEELGLWCEYSFMGMPKIATRGHRWLLT